MVSALNWPKAQALPRQQLLRAPGGSRARSCAALRPQAWLFPGQKAKPEPTRSANLVISAPPKVQKLPIHLLRPGNTSTAEDLNKNGLLSSDLVFRPSIWQRLKQQHNPDTVQRALQGAAAYVESQQSWDFCYPDRAVAQSWVAEDESTGEAFIMSIMAPGQHESTFYGTCLC